MGYRMTEDKMRTQQHTYASEDMQTIRILPSFKDGRIDWLQGGVSQDHLGGLSFRLDKLAHDACTNNNTGHPVSEEDEDEVDSDDSDKSWQDSINDSNSEQDEDSSDGEKIQSSEIGDLINNQGPKLNKQMTPGEKDESYKPLPHKAPTCKMQQVRSTSILEVSQTESTDPTTGNQPRSTTDRNMLSDIALKLQTVQQDLTQHDMASKASVLKQITQLLRKFDKKKGMVKTKTTTSKNDNEMFVEDTVFVPCDNLEKLPVLGFYSVPKQTENSVNIKKRNDAECPQRHKPMLINLNQDAFDLAVLGRRMEIRELKDEHSVVGQLLDRRTRRLRPYVHLAARYPEGKMKPDDPVLKDTTGRRLTLRATSLNVYEANSLNELQIIPETGKAMGCAWEKSTCTSGTQLTNTALINALKAQTCFEESELLGFEVPSITVCKQGMTVFSKTSYTEFHQALSATHVHGRST